MLWHEFVIPVDHHITLVMSVFCTGIIIKKFWLPVYGSSTCTVVCKTIILSKIHEVNCGDHIS